MAIQLPRDLMRHGSNGSEAPIDTYLRPYIIENDVQFVFCLITAFVIWKYARQIGELICRGIQP